MLEFRQKVVLSTALTLSLCHAAAHAHDVMPATTDKPPVTSTTTSSNGTTAAVDSIEVQHSSAPVPGNAPLQLFTPISERVIGPGLIDDTQKALFPPESDEAIKKANDLHAQATEQLKKGDFVQAIKLDEEAAKVAPHYWLPHVALAYLYSNYKGGGPAFEQASTAVRCQHTGMADNTYATMISAMHALAPAMEKYKQLAAADPTSWRAKVGLASCYLSKNDPKSATALLDELNNASVKDPTALLVMGSFYKKANELDKAKDVLKRGLENNPESKIKEKLLVQLFEVAVATNDRQLITDLKTKVSPILDARQRAWLRTGNIKLAQTPAEAKLALQLAETETVLDSEYRGYAKIFDAMAKANPAEQTAWLKLSREALIQALAVKPADLQNKTLLASVDEQLGDKQEALKVMHAPSPLTATEAEQDVYLADYYKKSRKAQDLALAKLFVADKDGYKCLAQAIDFKMPSANCKCKVNSASSMAKSIPGVFDVVVGPGDSPTATVIFDRKKITGEAIFQNQKMKNLKDKLVVSNERPVNTIVELAQVYGNQDQNQLAQSPSVQMVMLQYPTAEDAVAAVSVGSAPQAN